MMASALNDQRDIELSVCLVSWNSKDTILACLDSIYQNSEHLSLEVIVVDNDSTDGTPQLIRSSFPLVRLIENSSNRGFGRAQNTAIDFSTGKYVLVLNPDVSVTAPVLRKMIEFAGTKADFGALGCRLVGENGDCERSYSLVFPNAINSVIDELVVVGPIRRALNRSRRHENAGAVNWIVGACMLIERSTMVALGCFDERYFMYCEDVDLCYRLRQKGLQVYYDPAVAMIHIGGASSKRQDRWYFTFVLIKESLARFLSIHRGSFSSAFYRLGTAFAAVVNMSIMAILLPVVLPVASFRAVSVARLFGRQLKALSWGLGREAWAKAISTN